MTPHNDLAKPQVYGRCVNVEDPSQIGECIYVEHAGMLPAVAEVYEPTHLRDAKLEITDHAADVRLTFRPQPDITAYEMAQLWSKGIVMVSGRPVSGLAEWLVEQNLMRHFEVR